MTGLPVVLGSERSPCDVFMQIEGEGQRISALELCAAMDKSNTLRACFQRFAHVFSTQLAYTALASAQGDIEERLARWLLMAQDRVGTNVLALTPDVLAVTLGVRRASVTSALGELQRAEAIEIARRSITVKDRNRLRDCADGLYGQPEAEHKRLFNAAATLARAR